PACSYASRMVLRRLCAMTSERLRPRAIASIHDRRRQNAADRNQGEREMKMNGTLQARHFQPGEGKTYKLGRMTMTVKTTADHHQFTRRHLRRHDCRGDDA